MKLYRRFWEKVYSRASVRGPTSGYKTPGGKSIDGSRRYVSTCPTRDLLRSPGLSTQRSRVERVGTPHQDSYSRQGTEESGPISSTKQTGDLKPLVTQFRSLYCSRLDPPWLTVGEPLCYGVFQKSVSEPYQSISIDPHGTLHPSWSRCGW